MSCCKRCAFIIQFVCNRCSKPASTREVFGTASAQVQRALFNDIQMTNVPGLRLTSRQLQKDMVASERAALKIMVKEKTEVENGGVKSLRFILCISIIYFVLFVCSFLTAARSANTRKRKNKFKDQARGEIAEFISKTGAEIDRKQGKKKLRSDVEAAVFLATKNLKTSPEVQNELSLSESQVPVNRRIRTIKKGACRLRMVSVVVRCQVCCRGSCGSLRTSFFHVVTMINFVIVDLMKNNVA